MCGSHSMKMYRYGDPHYNALPTYTDLVGYRFGTLVVLYRTDRDYWMCKCTCGAERKVLAGGLNRDGDSNTCGDRRVHQRSDLAGYHAVHVEFAKTVVAIGTIPVLIVDSRPVSGHMTMPTPDHKIPGE